MEEVSQWLDLVVVSFAEREVTVGQLIIVPSLFILGFLLARWLGYMLIKRMQAREMDPDIIHLVRRIYLVLVILVLALSALEILNVPLTAFAFISGAIAIGVGFGAQNIINNFISGWILLWERPIRIGDFLEVGDAKGKVEEINTRSTRIRRVDGVHMLIPNSYLLENTVVNWTLVDRLARSTVRVGVAYGSPVRKVEELIYSVVSAHKDALSEPPPMVVFEDFGDSSLVFDLYFWSLVGGEKDLRRIRSDIRYAIDGIFHEHDITIAFPQRDVHLNSLAPVQVTLMDKPNSGDMND